VFEYSNISAIDADGASEPVTLNEAKAWLKVDYSDDDTVITGLIKGARQTIEKLTSLALVNKSVTLTIETTKEERVTLPYGSVSALVVTDDEDETLELNDTYSLRGNMLSLNGSGGVYHLAYTVAVTDVPQALKEAILMEVAERYDNKGEAKEGISEPAKKRAIQFAHAWL